MKCKKQLIASQVSRALIHCLQMYFGDSPGEAGSQLGRANRERAIWACISYPVVVHIRKMYRHGHALGLS